MVVIVTLRQGGNFEFDLEPEEVLRWQVEENGTLVMRNAYYTTDGGYPKDSDFSIFRVFAHGVWADLEVID